MLTNQKIMKTAIFLGHGQPFEIREIASEIISENAIIETEACTLCSSDLHTVSGRRTSPVPGVLGHEAIGQIVYLPKTWELCDVAGNQLRIGQRVIWGVAASCGNCIFCQNEIPQKCVNLIKYGHCHHNAGSVPRGGLSQLVEIVKGTPLVALSDEIPAGIACLAACAGATVAAAIRLCGEFHLKSVVVTGGGVLGVVACRMAKSLGAKAVVCTEPDKNRRTRALEFGADLAIDPREDDAHNQIKLKCNDGAGADYVMEFSGSNAAFETGLAVLRTGGTILMAGAVFPSGSVAIQPEQIIRRMLTIRGLHNYTAVDLQTAVAFLELESRTNPELWASLMGEQFPLEKIEMAFDWAARNPGVRAVISMMGDKSQ
jgi:putative phosphonate catabolism associated alcohol dehydrogenase